MNDKTTIVENTIRKALADQQEAGKLLANPAQAFNDNGFDLPEIHTDSFNNHFTNIAGDIITKLNLVNSGESLGLSNDLLEADSLPCTLCKIACYTEAIAIVAIGVAGLALLTVASPIVLAVAAFAAVSAELALAFIIGLTTAITLGIDAVIMQLCVWTRHCPA